MAIEDGCVVARALEAHQDNLQLGLQTFQSTRLERTTRIVEGSSATYLSVLPGVDLVVKALPSGFSKRLVVHERPSSPLAVRIGLVVSGVVVVESSPGSFLAQAPDGEVAARWSSAWMWDGSGAADDPGSARPGRASATPISTPDPSRLPG